MMFGLVNRNCEAVIKVAVGQSDAPKTTVDAIIDTEFTTFLSLPMDIIIELGLIWRYRDIGTLGDGNNVIFEMFRATVIWDGQRKAIDVAASDSESLVGMGLLYGFKLQIEAVEGRTVVIDALG